MSFCRCGPYVPLIAGQPRIFTRIADEYTPTVSRLSAMVVIDILSTAVSLARGVEDQERFANMKSVLTQIRTRGDGHDGR